MRFLILVPVAIFFFACADPNSENSFPEKTSAFLPDSSKQRLLTIIEGGWLNEAYVKALLQSHSPMEAAAAGWPEQQMAFDIANVDGDTMRNAQGRLHYHEGERFDVVFYRKENGSTGMRIDEDKNFLRQQLLLDYTIENGDTLLLLTIAGSNKTMRFQRQFRKFPESGPVVLTAMEYRVNKEMVAGKWKSNDDTVQLNADGTVTHFNHWQRYAITTEHDHPQSRPDEISFYNDSAGVVYAFTLRDNRLNLYELEESNDGQEFSRGKLMYSFSKCRTVTN